MIKRARRRKYPIILMGNEIAGSGCPESFLRHQPHPRAALFKYGSSGPMSWAWDHSDVQADQMWRGEHLPDDAVEMVKGSFCDWRLPKGEAIAEWERD